MTKIEKERETARIAAAWRRQHPDRPVPNVLLRWCDNLPDERDVEFARRTIERPDVQAAIASLNSGG